MGKLTGWEKTKKSQKWNRWRSETRDLTAHIVLDKNIPFGNNDNTWYFMVKNSNKILKIKRGLTKQKALDLAINYMKTNPKG